MRDHRVVSLWYLATVLTGVLLAAAVAVAFTIGTAGLARVAWGGVAAATILFAVTVVVAFGGRRRRPLPLVDSAGDVVVRSPAILAGSIVGSWLAILASSAAWVLLAVSDFSRLTPAGPLVVVVLGSIGSLPELARLVTGRLHRWTLTLAADGLTYQGYRRSTTCPWTGVRHASAVYGKNAAVVVDLKASRPDLTIPASAFLVHPQALADAINARVGSRG